MKKVIFSFIIFCFGMFFVNAEATRTEYYDKTTDINFFSSLPLEYTTIEEYPNELVAGAYFEALFYNDTSKFMMYTVRHCISDENFNSEAFSSISKEEMRKGVSGKEYHIKYGYFDSSKEEVVAVVGTYDENFYYYMVFMFPTLNEYYKSLVETIVDSVTFGYKKDVTTCEGNTGSENFEGSNTFVPDNSLNLEDDKQSTNDKYYHPEENEEQKNEIIDEDNILDYEALAREEKVLENRNLLLKGVISVIFLLAFVYITSSNKFEFSVFGMFFMIFQLAFVFLIDLNLINGYSINYIYTIIYSIPGFISVLLSTRKPSKKEVVN